MGVGSSLVLGFSHIARDLHSGTDGEESRTTYRIKKGGKNDRGSII